MEEDRATKHNVELWIKTIPTGEFHYTEVLDKRIASQYYGRLRKYIHELCKKEIIEPVGRRDGYYRVIENGLQPIDFSNVRSKQGFDILLPFNLREFVFVYPNTAIVIAGSKSSGKTGFLYRTVKMNLDRRKTLLFSNMEGGAEQMYDRFLAMGIDLVNHNPRFIYPLPETGFHDVVKEPDTLYVLDYIDAPEGTDFYLIGGAITKVRKKLRNSVAVIGLQKPMGRDTAFGGEQTLKDTALYIALDSHKLKIVDAKVPANKKVHPKNMQWTFLYDDEGTNFINIQQSYLNE